MESRKRIVQLIITLEVGGCESALLRMLPLLDKAFEHTIITLRKKGPLASAFKNKGIRVIAIEQKSIFDISSYIRLKRTLQDMNPDLIMTNLLHADFIGRFFIQFFVPCKVISSLVTTYNFKRYWLARLFERLSKGLADGYMANSESVKKTYVEKFHVPEKKITVIPAGIDTNLFLSIEKDIILKEELGIPLDNRVIICVGSLHKNKGHRFLLSAFEEIYNTYPHTKLLIVGSGVEKDALLKQIERYQSKNAICFLGRRDDVPKLLRLSDVFILPTFFEGMSNAIMEAMAAGLPIITTDIPENKEIVHHEQTALLCPVGDAQCLSESLKRLLDSPSLATSLAEKARVEITKKYNFIDTTRQWNDFFSLMSGK